VPIDVVRGRSEPLGGLVHIEEPILFLTEPRRRGVWSATGCGSRRTYVNRNAAGQRSQASRRDGLTRRSRSTAGSAAIWLMAGLPRRAQIYRLFRVFGAGFESL
jgi:hypothetical protein